jgi:hypothetical protein
MKLDAEIASSAGAGALVINEVFPINANYQNPDGSYAGWVELYNPGSTAIDVGDMSLSDEINLPRKFVFAAGTMVPAGGVSIHLLQSARCRFRQQYRLFAAEPGRSRLPLRETRGGRRIARRR